MPPGTCVSKNSTNSSIDLEAGRGFDLLLAILPSFSLRHIPTAEYQRVFRRLVYKEHCELYYRIPYPTGNGIAIYLRF